MCRFDFLEKENYSEFSININPAERGKGYSKQLLFSAIDLYLSKKKRILRAKIKENNIPSIKLFTSLGFLLKRKVEGIVHFKFTEKLIFKKVETEDSLTLYDLLKERNYNISHKVLPDFKSHKRFVEKNPYLYWYIFSLNEKAIGTFYIKDDNSIGINTNVPTKK